MNNDNKTNIWKTTHIYRSWLHSKWQIVVHYQIPMQWHVNASCFPDDKNFHVRIVVINKQSVYWTVSLCWSFITDPQVTGPPSFFPAMTIDRNDASRYAFMIKEFIIKMLSVCKTIDIRSKSNILQGTVYSRLQRTRGWSAGIPVSQQYRYRHMSHVSFQNN